MIIYTNTPTKEYFAGIEGAVGSVEIVDSRAAYMLCLKLFNEFRLVRRVFGIFFGKRKPYAYNPSFKEIVRSFFMPFRLLFEKRFVVLFQPYDFVVFYLLLLKLLGKRFVYMTSWPYWDGSKFPYGSRALKLVWEMFCRGQKAVCISKRACSELRRREANAVWIPHSVDTNLFLPEQERGKKRRGANESKAGNTDKRLRILCLGRLIKEKGIEDLLRLAEEINARFVFAGESGDMEGEVRNAVERGGNVVYLGSVKEKGLTEKRDIYRNADIFISNSYATAKWEELFGMAILEAMASGLAIIATDCVGPRELIENGKNGLLVRQRDYEGLKGAVLELIKDKRMRIRLGRNARRLALQFDKRIIAERWKEVLKRDKEDKS